MWKRTAQIARMVDTKSYFITRDGKIQQQDFAVYRGARRLFTEETRHFHALRACHFFCAVLY